MCSKTKKLLIVVFPFISFYFSADINSMEFALKHGLISNIHSVSSRVIPLKEQEIKKNTNMPNIINNVKNDKCIPQETNNDEVSVVSEKPTENDQ